jgi:hypothetical protein
MKRVVLMIVPALICGIAFTSCASNEAEPKNEKLYVIGTKSATVPTDKTDLVFTGNDIVSYNPKTGELIFTKVKVDDIRYRIGLYSTLYFYLNDEPLFDPPLRIHSEVSSIMDVLGLSIWESKIYFHTHTQNYDFIISDDRREALEKEQDELVQKRKMEMGVFIKYLSDAGKIDNTDAGCTDVLPDVVIPIIPVDSTKIK